MCANLERLASLRRRSSSRRVNFRIHSCIVLLLSPTSDALAPSAQRWSLFSFSSSKNSCPLSTMGNSVNLAVSWVSYAISVKGIPVKTLELDFTVQFLMSMHCDNQTTIFIANNPAFHECTKHIEVDCHYVKDTVMRGIISTSCTPSEQLVDIFTKWLGITVFDSLCNRLGMLDIHAPV